jgi:hypothetical protein
MKKFFIGVLISAFIISCNEKTEEPTTTTTTADASSAETKTTGDEMLPTSEGDWAKTALAAFAKGDIDGMTANYEDTVLYLWSSMDSLRGKKAVQDYYKGRWKLIDSLSFSDHVILPVNMAVQQTAFAPTGRWTLAWSFAHVKYKNGKKLNFWVHNVYHHNSSGKVDFVGQYIDRAPINAASK